jgi:plastocyanin
MDYRVAVAFLGLLMVTSGCVSSLSDDAEPSEDTGPETEPEQENNISDRGVDSGPESDSEIDRTIEVTGGSYYFEPGNIEVEQGQTVEFVLTNEGGFHDLVIPELDERTERIRGGETDSVVVTFSETGEFEFICSVGTHAQQGMRGTITVS